MFKSNTLINKSLAIGICILLNLVFFSSSGFGINNKNTIGDQIKLEYNPFYNTNFNRLEKTIFPQD